MKKSTFWTLLTVLIILIVISPLAFRFMGGFSAAQGSWMMGPGHFMGGSMFMFPAIMLIVILVAIYAIFGRQGLQPPGQNSSQVHRPSESALDILKERYARGELSREEFEQMKQTLQD